MIQRSSMIQPFMSVESCRSYIDNLYSTEEKCHEAIICLKNSVIGSNRQKGKVIAQGVVSRLMHLLGDINLSFELRTDAAITLSSLAKGTDAHIKQLIDVGIVPFLLEIILGSEDSKLTEACLRCVCSVFRHPDAPTDLVFVNVLLVSHLLRLILRPANNQDTNNVIFGSISNRISVTTIFSIVTKNADHQMMLCDLNVVNTLAAILSDPVFRYPVLMPTLQCLAKVVYQNPYVSAEVVKPSFGRDNLTIPQYVVNLMTRDRPSEMQLAAARCLTYLHRADAISSKDSKILYKTLPCLVVLCKKDRPCHERILAAETLAYLTEVDTELQRLAAISNHLIPTLADFLHYQPEHNNSSTPEQEEEIVQDMKQAAFKVFASLGANDEDIRKKIIETDSLMEHVVLGLQISNPKVRLAAVRCLHSLSRSVQQLRTTFQDHSVWKPLMQLLQGATDDVLSVASSTLCNLLLDFSPSKEPIVESGAVDLLCDLTRRPDPALRLNGIWALMNMAFQAEQRIKYKILNTLGTDQMFRLLSDPQVDVLMKTLGLLRNLLSTKSHIDHIMGLHGNQIMQAVILILEGNHIADVKEQALCILANIGDGESAKDYIMANEDVLKKLQDYMMHSNVKLQIAAIFCISNLVWKNEKGSAERQAKLKEMGVYKLLQQLIMTTDTILYDKVKSAMTQFSEA